MKRLLLLLAMLPLSAEAVSVRYNLAASSDGIYYTAWPSGNKPSGGSLPGGWSRCTVDQDGVTLNSFVAANNEVTESGGTFTIGSISGTIAVGSGFAADDHMDGPCQTISSANDAILIARLNTENVSQGATFYTSGWMIRATTDEGSVYIYTTKVATAGLRIRVRDTTNGNAANLSPAPITSDLSTPLWLMVRLDRETDSIRAYYFQGASNPGTNPATNWVSAGEYVRSWLGTGDLLAILASSPNDTGDVGENITATYDNVSTDYATELDHSSGTNSAPVWNSTPAPTFVEDVAGSYPLPVSDADGDTLAIANEDGCTLPTGVTIDDTNDEIDYNGLGSAGTTPDCVFSADDGTASPVNSNAFNITISASGVEFAASTPQATSIVPGVATPAAYWGTLPSFHVYRITTTSNGTGTGTYYDCVTGSWTGVRVCVFDVSGTIDYPSPTPNGTIINTTDDYLIEAGQTAPSPGIIIKDATRVYSGRYALQWHMTYANGAPLATASGFNENSGDNIRYAGTGNYLCMNSTVLFTSDEGISTTNAATDSALYQCLVGWSLDAHKATSALFNSGRIDIMRSGFAHSKGRNPRYITEGTTVEGSFLNNVVYNYGNRGINPDGVFFLNNEGNWFIKGPDSNNDAVILAVSPDSSSRMWYATNRGMNGLSDQPSVTNQGSATILTGITERDTSFYPTGYSLFNTASVSETVGLELVTSCMGARPNDRMSRTQDLIDDILSEGSSGSIISNPSTVGGLPTLAENPANHSDIPSNPNAAGTHINAIMDWLVTKSDNLHPPGKGCD